MLVGAGGSDDLANFTTGVAIANVDEEDGITLFFGCEQEQPEWGGAGLLRLLPDTGAPSIFPLRQNNQRIHAGAMFLAKACDPNSVRRWTASIYVILAAAACIITLQGLLN